MWNLAAIQVSSFWVRTENFCTLQRAKSEIMLSVKDQRRDNTMSGPGYMMQQCNDN
jgi:hypothetical protein